MKIYISSSSSSSFSSSSSSSSSSSFSSSSSSSSSSSKDGDVITLTSKLGASLGYNIFVPGYLDITCRDGQSSSNYEALW